MKPTDIHIGRHIRIGQCLFTVSDVAEEGQMMCLVPGRFDSLAELNEAPAQGYWVSFDHLIHQIHKYGGSYELHHCPA